MRALRENRVSGTDECPLWYRVVGDGPALVCCNGVGVSTIFWNYLERAFGNTHRVLTWDYRGHGRSGQPAAFDDWSMVDNVRDLEIILDDAEIDRAVFLGHSMGCQVILEAWRHIPERIAGLVPILGVAGKPVRTFFNTAYAEYLYKAGYALGMKAPSVTNAVAHFLARRQLSFFFARQFIIDRQLARWEDFARYFAHMAVLDVRVFFAMARAMAEHDAEDLLPTITVPTLVVGGEKDVFTPMWRTQEMASAIPEAELMVVKKGSHAALVEQPDLINLRLEKFFNQRLKEWDRR